MHCAAGIGICATISRGNIAITDSEMNNELNIIASELESGNHVDPVTVRTFLGWFGSKRRGPKAVRYIRAKLDEHNVATDPDFESTWIDANINFTLKNRDIIPIENNNNDDNFSNSSNNWVSRDATYRISKLAAANRGVISISPDSDLSEAITLLLARDISQIPVMVNERDVKGIVSWKSIGTRLSLGSKRVAVRHFMVQHHEMRSNMSIFDAIPYIIKYDYILVRGTENSITGILTSSDLNHQFLALSEPFLLLSEIENLIRNLIGSSFNITDINMFLNNDNEINNIDDLTFGDYIRILQNPERWTKLNINLNGTLFCKDLDYIRIIRNDVTHFDPDGITSEDLERLRDFKSFLHNLETLTGHPPSPATHP